MNQMSTGQQSVPTRYKVVFEHDPDPDPDFSWLEQDQYLDPVYPTEADREAGANAYDPVWYRDPKNHVALSMLVYTIGPDDDDWQLIDSLGGIDFLEVDENWGTGTYYRLADIPAEYEYLRELAQEAGVR